MEKIIFVYNKDSRFMNGIFDFFHKLMKPATYNCSLCLVTYNYFGMRMAWKNYLSSLPIESDFYHKDEFNHCFTSAIQTNFPAIFLLKDNQLIPIVDREELDQSDLVDLMKLINKGIKNHQ